jgi:hypothetical protein
MVEPSTLYESDLLLWAEQQAEALARLRSELRSNAVDWDNLIEEVRDLGLSELRSCASNLQLAALHLLKLARWPDHPARVHWVGEAQQFLSAARANFWPSMRQRLDPDEIGRKALREAMRTSIHDHPARALPQAYRADIDAMLSDEFDIEAAVAAIGGQAAAEQQAAAKPTRA